MSFCETEAVLDGSPIRQGDVLLSLSEEADGWSQAGIIVTGDCDLALNKHGGRLSYVPVLTTKHYLAETWLPKRLRRSTDALATKTVALVRRLQEANLDDFPQPLSAERVREWIFEEEAGSIADTLGAHEGAEREKLTRLVSAYSVGLAAIGQSFDTQWSALCSTIAADQNKPLAGAHKQLRSEAADLVQNLPGDSLFVGGLTPDHPDGYVAYLRILQQTSAAEVALRPKDIDGSVKWHRPARLISPYIFHLTQRLGNVFSSIGLPTEYEENRQLHSEYIVPDPTETGSTAAK